MTFTDVSGRCLPVVTLIYWQSDQRWCAEGIFLMLINQ